MDNYEKEKIIRTYISCYNAFDVDGMLAVLDDDICFINMSNGDETAHLNGREAFKQLADQSKTLFISREQVIDDIRFEPEETVVSISYSGVLAVDLPDGLEKGQTLELKGVSRFQFQGNKISSIIDESS